jgi:hypothetical protein
MSTDGEPIWVPAPDDVRAANVSRFARWILQGCDPGQVMEAGAVDNPDALQWFAAYQTRTSIP